MDPSPELVESVRRMTRAWGVRRGMRHADLDDLEGDALEWLCRYEPPEGWDPRGAVITKLHWQLRTIARDNVRALRRTPWPHGLDLDGVTHEQGYDAIDSELLLDSLDNADERRALLACSTLGDAAVLARREHVHLSTIHHRARRARAHVLAAWEEP